MDGCGDCEAYAERLDEVLQKDRIKTREYNLLVDENKTLREKMRRQRRALRQLNKAHATLWKVIGLRNDFHAFAVNDGSFIRYRDAMDSIRMKLWPIISGRQL